MAHMQIPLLDTGLSPDSLPGLPAAHLDPSSARSQVEPGDIPPPINPPLCPEHLPLTLGLRGVLLG